MDALEPDDLSGGVRHSLAAPANCYASTSTDHSLTAADGHGKSILALKEMPPNRTSGLPARRSLISHRYVNSPCPTRSAVRYQAVSATAILLLIGQYSLNTLLGSPVDCAVATPDIARIMHGNWLRLLRRAWPA